MSNKGLTGEWRAKQFGVLHPSGKNRAERRAEDWQERHKAQADKRKRWEEYRDLQREQRAESVRVRQEASHARAVARRAVAKVVTKWPTRAKQAIIDAFTRRREERRQRREKYQKQTASV